MSNTSKHSHNHGHSHGDHQHGGEDNNKWSTDWESWDSHPGVHDISARMINMLKENKVLSKENGPSLSVLDFGCGTGYSIRKLAKEYQVQAHAVDVEKEMIRVIAKKMKEEDIPEEAISVKLLETEDASDLEGKYDIIFTTNVIGHIREEHVDEVLKNLVARLNPGGHIAIGEFEEVASSLNKQAMETDEEHKFVSDGGDLHTNFTFDDLTERLNKAGVEVVADTHVELDSLIPDGEPIPEMFILAVKK